MFFSMSGLEFDRLHADSKRQRGREKPRRVRGHHGGRRGSSLRTSNLSGESHISLFDTSPLKHDCPIVSEASIKDIIQ